MINYKIQTLLFQGQIVTTDYSCVDGVIDSQVLLDLSSHRCFGNVIKIDRVNTDDSVETIYSNDDLVVLVDSCISYVEGKKDA